MTLARARQVHEKEARRREILAAGRQRFEAGRFDAITMAQVAADAGLAKGTVYLYFKSKEELFLALVEEDLQGFFEAMDTGLASGRLFFGPEELAALVVRSYLQQPQLPRLLCLLHPVLEHNVDLPTIQAFREFLAARCARTGRILEQRLTFLREGEGAPLLLRLHAITIGCWELTDAAPVVEEGTQKSKLKLFKLEFTKFLSTTLSAMIAGIEEQSRRKK